jgi:hypothetical protein
VRKVMPGFSLENRYTGVLELRGTKMTHICMRMPKIRHDGILDIVYRSGVALWLSPVTHVLGWREYC